MKMVKILAIGLVLFAVSAGASYFLLMPKLEVAKDKEEQPKGEGNQIAEHENTPHPPPAGPNEAEITKTSQMPVSHSIVNDKPMSQETLLELARAIRDKEVQMSEREQHRLREEQRLSLLFEDLRKEQHELTALGEAVDAKITAAKQILEQVKQERTAFQAEKKAAGVTKSDAKKSGANSEADQAATERLEKVKDWFQSLEADKAAKFIKEFSNNGELDFVCQLLQNLEPKQSAKILSALDDPALVANIVSRIGSPRN